MFISDYPDINALVLTFEKFMEGMDLKKYLKDVPEYYTGRIGYNSVGMLKTVLFGFMSGGYISLRELEEYVDKIDICGTGRNSYCNIYEDKK